MLPLLAGESLQNLILWSEEFTKSGVWLNGSVSVSLNQTAGPFGGASTADRVTFNAQFAKIRQNFTVVADRLYTWSCFIKQNSGNTALVIRSEGAMVLNEPITVTSAWQRFSLTKAAASSGTANLIAVQDRNAAGFGVVDIWGAQLTFGGFPGQYVKTEGVPVL